MRLRVAKLRLTMRVATKANFLILRMILQVLSFTLNFTFVNIVAFSARSENH